MSASGECNFEIVGDILKEVAAFCDEHGICYGLIYGTLIGAVRHGDFIPWDDDADIMMPRPDYDRFCELWKKEKADSPLELFLPLETPGYPYMIARVSDSRYPIIVDNEKPYGMGLFVDIYPFDGLGRTWVGSRLRAAAGDIASSLCFQAAKLKFPREMFGNPAFCMVGRAAFAVSKLAGSERLMRLIKRIPAYDYEKARYIGPLIWITGGSRDVFPRSWFDRFVRKPLGNYEYWVPAEYDKVLRHCYGSYMELPAPENRQGTHDYKLAKLSIK